MDELKEERSGLLYLLKEHESMRIKSNIDAHYEGMVNLQRMSEYETY